MSNPENLWSSKIGSSEIKVPKTVMIEQANLLGQMTQNRIIAEIKSTTTEYQGKNLLVHSFIIISPSMGNYSFPLFKVEHQIDIYPLDLFDYLTETWTTGIKEDQFPEELKSILSSDKTANIINGLIAQSE